MCERGEEINGKNMENKHKNKYTTSSNSGGYVSNMIKYFEFGGYDLVTHQHRDINNSGINNNKICRPKEKGVVIKVKMLEDKSNSPKEKCEKNKENDGAEKDKNIPPVPPFEFVNRNTKKEDKKDTKDKKESKITYEDYEDNDGEVGFIEPLI